MINTTYGTQILNAFFNTGLGSKTTKADENKIKSSHRNDQNNNFVEFPTDPYLALFTTMPNASGTGYAEPTSTYYNRVSLTTLGPKALQLMGGATVEAGTGEYSGKNVAVVKNQDIIVFPEVEEETEENKYGTVVGFGVFSAKTGGTLILWGDLTSPVPIEAGEIPVFRIDEFIFKLA